MARSGVTAAGDRAVLGRHATWHGCRWPSHAVGGGVAEPRLTPVAATYRAVVALAAAVRARIITFMALISIRCVVLMFVASSFAGA